MICYIYKFSLKWSKTVVCTVYQLPIFYFVRSLTVSYVAEHAQPSPRLTQTDNDLLWQKMRVCGMVTVKLTSKFVFHLREFVVSAWQSVTCIWQSVPPPPDDLLGCIHSDLYLSLVRTQYDFVLGLNIDMTFLIVTTCILCEPCIFTST